MNGELPQAPRMEPFRIKQRDRQSIELKFRYMLDRERRRKRQTYDVNVYFFLPYSFNINSASYDRNSFYDDLKLYLRFNTPALQIGELLDKTSRASPLRRIERMIRTARREDRRIDPDEFIYEGKLLGCIYKSILRDRFANFATQTDPDTISRTLASIGEIREVARRFHRATSILVRRLKNVEPHVRQHMLMIDEHLSLLIEKYAATLYETLRRSHPLVPHVSRLISKEVRYREKAGYPTVVRGKAPKEKLEERIYREKMLKRYVSEVLFFDVRRRNTAKGMEQILYAAAAGIAMMFATSIAFLGQSTFGSLTTALFLLLVVSYMLKDRLKDFFRDLLRKSVSRRIFDRKAMLYDARRHSKLAVVRERTYFLENSQVDPGVIDLRNQGTFEQALARTTAESLFVYHKRIQLQTKTMRGIHRRIGGVADISILDLGGFLRHLAAQGGLVPVESDRGVVELHPVKRIYHLNLIVHMRSDVGADIRRYRLIVDASGIERIEAVSVGQPVQTPG
ncbi:MAG TPA: hypothetical protein VMW87_13985 [Spirochaetia bacterium]|nr:hypothetical protein [Spirochaetia bacterium]